jgi:ABC-2 type transport system permease protein
MSYALFFNMTGTVMSAVREGSFDLMLIRPAPAAFLSVMQSLSMEDGVVFLSGLAIFLYAAANLHIALGVASIIWPAILFVAGIAVLFGFTLIMSAIMFKWVGNSRIFEIFESIAGFGRYPSIIFPGAFRLIATYIIPVAALGSLPAEVFLGKQPAALAQLFPVVLCCAGFVLFGYFIWKATIRSYISSGG